MLPFVANGWVKSQRGRRTAVVIERRDDPKRSSLRSLRPAGCLNPLGKSDSCGAGLLRRLKAGLADLRDDAELPPAGRRVFQRELERLRLGGSRLLIFVHAVAEYVPREVAPRPFNRQGVAA